jgi:serine/threonine-protein kinase
VDPARWEKPKAIAADAMELEGEARAPASPPTLLRRARPRRDGARDEDARPPTELVERGVRRLGALALLYAAGYVAAYAVYEISVHSFGGAPYTQPPHTAGQVIAATFVGAALVVHHLAARRRLAPSQLVQVGLGFEVVGSLGIALASHSGPWPADGRVWGVSWICVWIMLFPFVIPAPPRGATIAAFLSAAMGPLALAAWAAARGTGPGPGVLLAVTAPNFVCAALASIGARHVHRIGLELREAVRFGSYRLVSRLGRGGMGEVWIAEHDLLARPAAIKLVRADLLRSAPDEVAARFEREAQSIAALSSPHTVRLYDFGLTDDGVFYYVMELLEGLDLDTLVRRFGRVPPGRAIRFLREACASLAEAHARGLVHRDIKPPNLFVCRQGLAHDVL